MTEKIHYTEFNKKYTFLSGKGLKAVPKGVDESKIKKHKYQAEATEIDGIKFPSKKEATVYCKLKQWESFGQISELITNAEKQGKDRVRYIFQLEPFKSWYEPDFQYFDEHTKQYVVADAKGVKTTEYKRKKRLMKKMFGIDILEY